MIAFHNLSPAKGAGTYRKYLIILFCLIITANTGCLSYKTCVNGKCTTTTKEWKNGRLKTTKCTNGKCTTTYGDSDTQANNKNNKKNENTNNTKEVAEPVFTYKPTANHKVFMKLMDSIEKMDEERPGETSAARQARQDKTKQALFKNVSLKKLCLKDVGEFGFDGYVASFYVPLTANEQCGDDDFSGYRAPGVRKSNMKEKEALKYKVGQKYDVSGRVTWYELYDPQKEKGDKKLNFIEKYFSRNGSIVIE